MDTTVPHECTTNPDQHLAGVPSCRDTHTLPGRMSAHSPSSVHADASPQGAATGSKQPGQDEAMAEKQDLDSIDLQLNIPDGEFLVGAIVLLKTVDQDNTVALRQRTSTGISWTERLGMLHAAVIVETNGITDDE